jgi:hypothetical protein
VNQPRFLCSSDKDGKLYCFSYTATLLIVCPLALIPWLSLFCPKSHSTSRFVGRDPPGTVLRPFKTPFQMPPDYRLSHLGSGLILCSC